MTPKELGEKYHVCFRGNCSEHETYDDCEKELVADVEKIIHEARLEILKEAKRIVRGE